MTEYTCGGCGETWSTNCAADDITCPECDAKWCPGCGIWFGGDAGEPRPADQGVTVSREDLALAVSALGRGEWTTTGDQRTAAAFARLNDALDTAGEATAQCQRR